MIRVVVTCATWSSLEFPRVHGQPQIPFPARAGVFPWEPFGLSRRQRPSLRSGGISQQIAMIVFADFRSPHPRGISSTHFGSGSSNPFSRSRGGVSMPLVFGVAVAFFPHIRGGISYVFDDRRFHNKRKEHFPLRRRGCFHQGHRRRGQQDLSRRMRGCFLGAAGLD
jgi:hypothetical protein